MKNLNKEKVEINDENVNDHILVINLNESSNAKQFEGNYIIHRIEYEKAIKLIQKQIQNAKIAQKENTINKTRHNDTISILGSRGSGKTSFLLSLLKDKSITEEAVVLKIIDPTLIEEKGHIFLNIISLIKDAVYEKLKFDECVPGELKYPTMKDWKNLMHKLADGLPSIDGIGVGLNEIDWKDAEFIMDRGLESVKAATNLENNFNDLISSSLKALNKKAFIITLDDIDVDFRKGWPVLETIRKYLTSPQIIVLLSGDLKLYSKAIRKQQWGNFGKALLINEADKLNKMNHYNDLVTEMESQYLQKVIKPENRIHLTSLFEKVTTYDAQIEISDKESDHNKTSRKSLQEYYNNVLEDFGIHNPYQAEAYRSYLMSLPLRTQIQFLAGYNEPNSNITDAFLSDLYEKEVDIDLAQSLSKMLNVVILKLLIKEQILAEAYQLQPTTTDGSLNSSLIALSFLFSQQVKSNPYLIFDYFIKIGYLRNLLPQLGYDEDSKSILKYSLQSLCNHSGALQDKVLKDIVGNINAFLESLSNKVYNGVFYLKGTAKREKGSNEESKGRIDHEFRDANSFQQIIGFIPVTNAQFLTKNVSIISYSIYTLFATIGELIKKIELSDLSNGLNELSQFRAYPMISFERKIFNQNEILITDEIKIKEDYSRNELIRILTHWHSNFPIKKISPHLLGKITTRIFYAFNSIDSNSLNNLGDLMHRHIVALMNAILVEDIRENYSDNDSVNLNNSKKYSNNDCVNLNLNNPINADDIFITNLAFAKQRNSKIDKLSFSRWLISCPLFLVYLQPYLIEDINFMQFINLTSNDYKSITNQNINLILQRVDIKKDKNTSDTSSTKFSGAKGKANATIEVLKPIISYSDFMGQPIESVIEICSQHFSSKIIPTSVSSLRGYVKDKNIQW